MVFRFDEGVVISPLYIKFGEDQQSSCNTYIPFSLPATKNTTPAAVDLHLAVHQLLSLYQGHQGLPADTWTQQAISLAKRLKIYPSYETIWSLDATISSSSSSSTTFICSPFYKTESANLYPLNDDRKLANWLGVAYFTPSGFFSLPTEDLSELVTSTFASIIELDSDAWSYSLPAKHKRTHHSCQWAIISAPMDRWDSDDIVNIYRLDIEGEDSWGCWPQFHWHEASDFLHCTFTVWLTLVASQCGFYTAQLYLDCMIPVDTNVPTHRDNGLFCSCDHSKKLLWTSGTLYLFPLSHPLHYPTPCGI